MAWTTPRTWTIGEFATKAILDTHVRDNLNAVKDGIVLLTINTRTTTTAAPTSLNALSWETTLYNTLGASGAATYLNAATVGNYQVAASVYLSGATGTGGGYVRIARYNSSAVLQEIVCAQSIPTLNGSGTLFAEAVTTAVNDRFYVEVSTDATGTGHSWTGRFSLRRVQVI